MLRLAWRRLAHRRALAAALWLGIFSAVLIGSATGLTLQLSSQTALEQALTTAGDRGQLRISRLGIAGPDDLAGFRQSLDERRRTTVGDRLQPQDAWLESSRFGYVSRNGGEVPVQARFAIAVVAAIDGYRSHATPVTATGRSAPPGTFGIELLDGAAEVLGATAGDTVCLSVIQDFRKQWCAFVSSVLKPNFPDPWWRAHPVDDLAFLTSEAGLFAILDRVSGGTLTAYEVLAPVPSRFQAANLDAELFQVRRFVTLTVKAGDTVETSLDDVISGYELETATGRYPALLVAAMVLTLVMVYIAMSAARALASQNRIFAVWRGRGARRSWICGVLMLEYLLLGALAVPAGLVAGFGAASLVQRLAFPGIRVTPDAVTVAVLVGAVLVGVYGVLAVIAVRASAADALQVRRTMSRPEPAWWRVRHLDLALAALAVPLLYAAWVFAPAGLRAATGDVANPLVAGLPALAVLMLAVAAIRVLPAVAAATLRFTRDAAVDLAATRLVRAPGAHAWAAVIVALSIAFGVFAATFAASDAAATADRAAYAAGADLRIRLSGSEPPIAELVGGLKGVERSSSAYRGEGAVGPSQDVSLLAVDPATLPAVARNQPDVTGGSLDRLLAPLAATAAGGLALPGRPASASMWIYGGSSAPVVLHLADSRGVSGVADLGRADGSGWRLHSAPIAWRQPPRYPASLREISIGSSTNAGVLGLSALAVDGTVIEEFVAESGWTMTDPEAGNGGVRVVPNARTIERAGRAVLALAVNPSDRPISVRHVVALPIPALAVGDTLERLGLRTREVFPFRLYGGPAIPVVAIGSLPHFPTVYPEREPAFLVALDPFMGVAGATSYPNPWPNEAWLRVTPGAERVDAALAGARDDAEVTDLRGLESAAAGLPARRSLYADLLLGIGGAAGLAVVAFALHFAIDTRSRLAELAVLAGNGIPAGLIGRSLATERTAVLGFGTVLGMALGAVLIALLVPSLQLAAGVENAVPPTQIAFDPRVGLAVLVALLVATFVAAIAVRTARRLDLVGELRQLQ